jgi:hypothetical protein
VIQNNAITNWGNADITIQNNDGKATVNGCVFGNSVTAPGASFPHAALFADNVGTAIDTSTRNHYVTRAQWRGGTSRGSSGSSGRG